MVFLWVRASCFSVPKASPVVPCQSHKALCGLTSSTVAVEKREVMNMEKDRKQEP